jgi:hypothetical protein
VATRLISSTKLKEAAPADKDTTRLGAHLRGLMTTMQARVRVTKERDEIVVFGVSVETTANSGATIGGRDPRES